MGAITEEQPAPHFDAGFLEILEFRDKRGRINHGPGADHGFLARSKYAAGDQLEDVAMAVEDDGVACIMAARVPRDIVERRSDVVYDFPFAFIAPLRADYY